MGRGASGGDSEWRGMLVLSRKENQREIGPLSDGDALHCVPCDEDARGHDDADHGDAEGTDLLRVS
jgi:hypothetical protein